VIFRADIDWFISSQKNCKISLSHIILIWCIVTGNGAFGACILTHHNKLYLWCLMEFDKQHESSDIICDVCCITFRDICSVSLHQRVHSGERPYSCDVCNIMFSNKNSLNKNATLQN